MRLDEYLTEHNLGEARVTEAFDISKMVTVKGKANQETHLIQRATMLQRQATATLHNLIKFKQYKSTRRGGTEAEEPPEVGIYHYRHIIPHICNSFLTSSMTKI